MKMPIFYHTSVILCLLCVKLYAGQTGGGEVTVKLLSEQLASLLSLSPADLRFTAMPLRSDGESSDESSDDSSDDSPRTQEIKKAYPAYKKSPEPGQHLPTFRISPTQTCDNLAALCAAGVADEIVIGSSSGEEFAEIVLENSSATYSPAPVDIWSMVGHDVQPDSPSYDKVEDEMLQQMDRLPHHSPRSLPHRVSHPTQHLFIVESDGL